jgi:DNA transposition AAA+ family ATPase
MNDRLQHIGRTEFRMLTDGQKVTEEQRGALVSEFEDWRSTQLVNGRPLSLKDAARRIGVSAGTLTDLVNGKYKGDSDTLLRIMDTHLAEERGRLGLRDLGAFARVRLTAEIFGAMQLAISLRSMAAVIAEPGTCKTSHALAFCQQRFQTYLVRVESEPADRTKVSEILCESLHDHRGRRELLEFREHPHSRRMREVKAFLEAGQNAVLVVDEAQKLSANGLELLRDLHDATGLRPERTPIIFFADERFKRLIGDTRDGKRTKMTAQLASRIYPCVDVAEQMRGSGGNLYTLDDILAITRNQRLKLMSTAAARWLTVLANVSGFGAMRTAIMVYRGALPLYADQVRRREPLTVEHLQEAFKYVMTKRLAEQIDQAAGGELLMKVAG